MRRIVYYVASSVDGFISGNNGDISGFAYAQESTGVKQYFEDLQAYDTVIMGKTTYEFGYQYGLEPGALAYPHMDHYIFSNSLELNKKDKRLKICPLDIEIIKSLKSENGKDIYLCGGGIFAKWLLEHQLIDHLKIKLNPVLLGSGIGLFGEGGSQCQLELIEGKTYSEGLQIITYAIVYSK